MKKNLLPVLLSLFFAAQNVSAQLSATISGTNPSCASNNGSATVTPTGGNNYTYKWSNGATAATASNLAAGTYTVTVYSTGGTIWDTLYLETFDGTQTWTLNISTGTNGADPNFWTISGNEGGVAPGGCGVANNGNATLHVTSVFNPTGGAAYDAGGLCGVLYCPQTNAAAESANISTTGANNLVITYDFIGAGQGLIDNASSFYSINGGSTYTSLDASLKSINTGCGAQGKWTQRSYYLPANCVGLSNFKIRFNWTNDDDGVGTDPSVAINNVLLRDSLSGTADSIVKTVTLTQPTGPHLVTATLSVVNPSCGQQNGSINNMSVAGGTPSYTLTWLVSGAQIGTGNSIANLGVGTYTFKATDANGCMIDTVVTLTASGTGGSASISTGKPVFCASDSTQICISGTFTSYLWNTGATAQCINVKLAGNYYVTVTDNTGCSAVSNHLAISVYPLPPVSISVNGDTLIAHNANTYQWFRNGTSINGAVDSVFIVAQAGTYSVAVTDGNGCQATSNGIVISTIENLGSEFDFKIYPNPSSSNLQLSVCDNLIGEEILVFNVEGKLLLKEKLMNTITNLKTMNFNSGVYFLKVKEVVKKFIKE